MNRTLLFLCASALTLTTAAPTAEASPVHAKRSCHHLSARNNDGAWPYGIGIVRTEGMLCESGARVMRNVAKHIKAGDYRHLGLKPAKRVAGFDCTANLIGDSSWVVTCRRDRRLVVASTAQ